MERRARQLRRRKQRAWLLAGVMLGIVLVAFLAANAYRQSARAQAMQAFVEETTRVLLGTLQLEEAGSAMEAHHRGYLLTGQQRFLDQREAAFRRGMAVADALRRAVADDPVQRPHARDAQRALLHRHAVMLRSAMPSGGVDPEDARTRFRGQGVGSYDWIRNELAAVRTEAERRLRVRALLAHRNADGFARLLLLGTIAALSLLLVTTWLLWRQLHQNEGIREELEHSLSLQDAILDAAGYMIIAGDPHGRITLFNAAASRALGYAPSEVVGKHTPLLFHDDDELRTCALERGLPVPPGEPVPFETAIELVLNAGREGTWTYVARDGRRFPVLLNVEALRNGDDTVVGYVGMARDITERRAAEQAVLALNRQLSENATALELSNRELEAFTYTVSHDLRAPLRHIDGYARMLREDAEGSLDDEMKRYIDAISDGARHMGMLIDDLLAFSRLNRKSLERMHVDMTDLARQALVEAGGLKSPAEVVIGPLPEAWADPMLLRQVWVNLLSNALKYSAPRGAHAHIRVTGERTGDSVRYTVSDNGVGFDMKYADKLFGVFQRLHSHDEFEGTGVGLAIVQRILARHGGHVFADAAPGDGARFTIELPDHVQNHAPQPEGVAA